MKFQVIHIIDATHYAGEIEANTADEALHKAWDNAHGQMLCHACAGKVTLGDVIRIVVTDENDNETEGS